MSSWHGTSLKEWFPYVRTSHGGFQSISSPLKFIFFPLTSFRAAQKLNLSSKRKKHQPSPLHPQEPSIYPTNFSGILQVSPPPAPPCLLRAVSKVKENPGMGKVRADSCQRLHTETHLVHRVQAWSTQTVFLCFHHKDPCLFERVKCHVATDWSTGNMPSGPVHADVAR